VYVENRAPLDGPFAKGSVGCIAGSVRSIGIDFSNILALTQEIERDARVSLFPICQGPNIPIRTTPPRQSDVTHGEPIDDMHLIPGSRYALDEIEVLLPFVYFRVVRNHFQRTLEHHVQGQLLGSCPQGHRHHIARDEVFEVGVVEGAWGVIHRTGEHTGEGKCRVVDRGHAGGPLGILLAHHAFAGDQVGIRAA